MLRKILGLLVLSLVFVGCGVTPPVEDTEKPTLTVTSPANNATVTTATLTVTGTAKDNTAVTKLSYTLNGGTAIDVTNKLSSGNFSFDVALGSAGSKTIKVTASDAAGNSFDVTRTVTLQAASTLDVTGKWELSGSDTSKNPPFALATILNLQQTGSTISGTTNKFNGDKLGNVSGTIQSDGSLTLRIGFEDEDPAPGGGHWNVIATANEDGTTFSGTYEGWQDDAETIVAGSGTMGGTKVP